MIFNDPCLILDGWIVRISRRILDVLERDDVIN